MLQVWNRGWWNHYSHATVMPRYPNPGGGPHGQRHRSRLVSALERGRIGIDCLRIANLAPKDRGCQRLPSSGFVLCAEHRAGGDHSARPRRDRRRIRQQQVEVRPGYVSKVHPDVSGNQHQWRNDLEGRRSLVSRRCAARGELVANSGVLPPHGAYFWGRGGNLIWTTYDEGAHWWTAAFGAGVDDLSSKNGTFEAVVFGAQVRATALQRFLYVSTNSGKTWKLRRQLADLRT